jgi:hypothetical protein
MRSRLSHRLAVAAMTLATLLGSSQAAEACTGRRALPSPVSCPGCWHPALDTSWQWKLSALPTAKEIASNAFGMWDIDGFDNSPATVNALQARSHVVCYLSAGSYEGWRADASSFPGSAQLSPTTPPHAILGVLGWKMDGWDERWLDIRDVQKANSPLAAIMQARIAMCRAKGFDAIEFDNVDGYTNPTGFPLTANDQLFYDTFLANEAHRVGLSAVLKNDNAQIPQLLPYFDFALNEECWHYRECTTAQNGSYGYDQFVAAGKAVFGVEYVGAASSFCPKANAQNFNWLKKKLDLGSWRTACR